MTPTCSLQKNPVHLRRKAWLHVLPRACRIGLALLLAATSPAIAQSTTRSFVSGIVTHASGAPVVSVSVALQSLSSGETRRTSTDAAGRFAFAAVSPGSYRVSASLDGIRGSATRTVNVTEARTYDINLRMDGADALETVVVTGTRSEQEIGKIASAVTVIDQDAIRLGQRVSTLEESLKRVSGVRVEDELGGNGSRVRIIVRGTGTRANSPAGSGVRGVKVLVDGLPKNNAGGSAQDLVNIDLQSAQRIEVLKGPSSVLYGNQSGGVVNILTEGPPASGRRLAYRQTVGAYGLFKEHFKFGARSGRVGVAASVYRNDQDGYRVQSKFHNTGVHSKFDVDVNSRSSLSLILDYDNNYQQSPGPLTEARYNADPRQADPVFVTNAVYAVVKELRLGAIFRSELFGQDNLELSGYVIPRELRPFQQIGVFIDQDFVNRGASARYLNSRSLGGNANRFTVGLEFQNTPIRTMTTSRMTSKLTSDLDELANTAGAYMLEEFSILPNLTVTAGGRYDYVRFESENLVLKSPQVGRSFRRFTPKVGLALQPRPGVSLYGNYSRGFETPVIGELRILPGGAFGFNENLDPQISSNYEVGARASIFDRRATLEAAVFRQDVENFISPFGTFPNNSFQNVGKVKQNGLELASSLALTTALTLSGAYTYSDFVFSTFNNGVSDFSGNRLPGVPRHSGHVELGYRSPAGLFAAIETQSVGRFFTNDANLFSNPPYAVTNLRFGYDQREGSSSLRFSPFFGVNNLFDRKYSAFAVINDTARRFFNPLPDRNIYGGLGVAFR